jgi:hypothetical protein
VPGKKLPTSPLADFFLTAGLITEAVIFVVYAFLPPPGSEMHAIAEALPKLAGGNSGNPALEKMDKMLQEADITPANLGRLSEGFKKLGTSVNNIAEVSDVVKATSDYSKKTSGSYCCPGFNESCLSECHYYNGSFQYGCR